MTFVRGFLVTAAIAAAVPLAPALGAGAKVLATNGAWEAYAHGEKAGKACYMASAPKSSDGAAKDRGTPYLSVTHRPADKSVDVVGVVAGYTYKKGSMVEVDVDGAKFKMFTNGGGAWMSDAAGDRALVAAMARGNRLTVRGTPAKGAATVDTYALAGFSASYAEIGKACGVK